MLPARETLLCSYRYDPLDRLVDCTPSAQPPTRRFYLKDRLATEIQDAVQRSIMQHEDQLLAQQQRQSGAVEAHLLATDQQRSVLNVLDVARQHPLAYSPYGHHPAESGLLSLLGFNGERLDPVTGCYLLGNGYRAFNPVLMRFNSPDSWSPFGRGGLNAYAYCVGDPVNLYDPTGHFTFGNPIKGLLNLLRLRTPSASKGISRLTRPTDYNNLIAKQQQPRRDPFDIGPSHSLREANPRYVLGHEARSSDFAPLEIRKVRFNRWINSIHNQPDKELKEFSKIIVPNLQTHTNRHLAVQADGRELSKLSQIGNDIQNIRFINDNGKETLRIQRKVNDFIKNEYIRLQRKR
jgi:RHS repeat-associated protein